MSMNNYSTSFGDIELKVTPEQMHQTAADLDSKVKDTKALFEEMQNLVEQTSSYWDGKVAFVARGTFTVQALGFNMMTSNLQKYASELETITQNYETTESKATESAQALPSNILS